MVAGAQLWRQFDGLSSCAKSKKGWDDFWFGLAQLEGDFTLGSGEKVEGPYCVEWQVGGVCFGVWEVLKQFKAIVLLTDYEILELEGVCGVCGEHTWLKCISTWKIFGQVTPQNLKEALVKSGPRARGVIC